MRLFTNADVKAIMPDGTTLLPGVCQAPNLEIDGHMYVLVSHKWKDLMALEEDHFEWVAGKSNCSAFIPPYVQVRYERSELEGEFDVPEGSS
jgi:hypothetical protein